jgi:hypothetical protein
MSRKLTQEIKEINRQVKITRDDLVYDIDELFYNIENIENQAIVFRTILRQFGNYDLKAIKEYVKISSDSKWNCKGGK